MADRRPKAEFFGFLRWVLKDLGRTLRAAMLLAALCATVLIIANHALVGGAIALALVSLGAASIKQWVKSRKVAAVEPRASEPTDHEISAKAGEDRQPDGHHDPANIGPLFATGRPHAAHEVEQDRQQDANSEAVGYEPEQTPRVPRQSG